MGGRVAGRNHVSPPARTISQSPSYLDVSPDALLVRPDVRVRVDSYTLFAVLT